MRTISITKLYFLQKAKLRPDIDTAGAAASLVCAVHCAVMPLIVTLLPLVGLGFLASERIEWALLSLSALLGVSNLCLGFQQHQRRPALMVLGVGLALLAGGRIVEGKGVERIGVPLVVTGGCVIASAHVLNRRFCRACRVCHNTLETFGKSDNKGKIV